MRNHNLTYRLRRSALLVVLGTIALAHGQAQQAPIQERPGLQPQIDLQGSGIATLDIGRKNGFGSSGFGSGSQVNISDSALTLGFSERLYRGGIGSFTLGALTLDQANSGRDLGLFLHQALMDYQTASFETYLGRTDNPSAQIVQFPTLRGDDLVDFTYLLNPFSNGQNLEEHRYGNIAAAVFNKNLRQFVNVHAQSLIDSENLQGQGSTELNSFGASYQYLALPTQEPLARFVSYGAGFEHRAVPRSFGGASEAVYAGGVVNLEPSLIRRTDLRLMVISTFGNSTEGFDTLGDTYRADATSIAASVRRLNSPFGMPGSSLSITAGYKTFNRVSDASEFGLALTGARRLGEGLDAIAQVGYTHRSDALAAVSGGHNDNVVLQLGLSFSFGSVFNQSVGPRRTPLSTRFRQIPN